MARWIEDRRVKIRRATRRDLPGIGALVGRALPTRFGRRAVADRRAEVYVADGGAEEGLVGVVGVDYRRSLSVGGVVAEVDPLVGRRPAVVEGLLDFVTTRARARGCALLALHSAPGLATLPDDPWMDAGIRIRRLGDVG